MVRMRFGDDEDSPLRYRIFELLRNSRTSTSEDFQAIMQCAILRAYIYKQMRIALE